MHGEDRLNIKTQLIISALKLAEFPDHISIDYVLTYITTGMKGNEIAKKKWTQKILLDFRLS